MSIFVNLDVMHLGRWHLKVVKLRQNTTYKQITLKCAYENKMKAVTSGYVYVLMDVINEHIDSESVCHSVCSALDYLLSGSRT